MKRIIIMILGIFVVVTCFASGVEKSYINDPDGYANARKGSGSNFPVVAQIKEAEIFVSYPQEDSAWYKVETKKNVTGYVHKSRIKTFFNLEIEVYKFFNEFAMTENENVEHSEATNADLFSLAQKFPQVFVTVFSKSDSSVQKLILKGLENPANDLKLIYSRIEATEKSASRDIILHSLKTAGSKSGLKLGESANKTQCGGEITNMLTSNNATVFMCHGPYEKINIDNLSQWQACIDATFYLKIEVDGQIKESMLFECDPMGDQEYRVQGFNVELRNFLSGYEDSAEKPGVVESYNITVGGISYTLLGKPPNYTREDVDNFVAQIDDVNSKPFNGETYFNILYPNLYRIRDYAIVDPDYSLSILMKFSKQTWVDGEVAETLSQKIGEAELLKKTVR